MKNTVFLAPKEWSWPLVIEGEFQLSGPLLNKTDEHLTDPAPPLAEWVDLHADALFRFAMLRVHDEHLAEDLLQETFLAALRSIVGFRNASAIRTWLTSILNHKIIDHYRLQAKVRKTVSELSEQQESAKRINFGKIQKWDLSPDRTIENEEFWNTLRRCLGKLPESISTAFKLREIDHCEPEAICRTLNISSQNLAVRIFRARQALQSCLNENWFSKS